MARITSELQWMACDQPQELGYFAHGRLDTRRFGWLAADWGGRIRDVFEPGDGHGRTSYSLAATCSQSGHWAAASVNT